MYEPIKCAAYEETRIAANNARVEYRNAQYKVFKAERTLKQAQEDLKAACKAFVLKKEACQLAEDAEFNAALEAFPEQF